MSGVFEDDDPGEGVFQTDEMVVVSGEGDVTPIDVELMVDGLRFMGLDPELVDEAEERFVVWVDEEGTLRTDHALSLWQVPVLRFHYRLERRIDTGPR